MKKYEIKTIHHVRYMGTSVYGNPYYMITWDDLSFSRTKVNGSINYDMQNSENIGVPVAVWFTPAGRVERIMHLDALYAAEEAEEHSRYRWIVYLHQPMGGFDVQRVASLDEAKSLLRQYSEETFVYEQASASLYPYSKEDWAEAKEYEEIGCPFDYPSKVMEFGPKGGIKVENA